MHDNVQDFNDRIKELYATQDWEGVIALSRSALRLAPETTYHLINLANALEQLSFTEEAISTWRELLRLTPEDAEACRRLGTIFEAHGRQAEAIEAYRQSIALNPKNGDVLFRLARILANSGNYREGLGLFEQALQMGEDNLETYYGKGFCLERLDNLQAAADMYSICVQKCPYNTRALNALGRVLANLGKKEQAIASWKRVIELDNSEFVARAKESLSRAQNNRWSNIDLPPMI